MPKTISKHLLTIDALNLLTWMEKENGFIATTKLPIRIQWDMNKNFAALNNIRNQYQEFEKKLQERYSDDEHSETSVDENGQDLRMVKKQFLPEFTKERSEILSTENDVEIHQFCIEDFGNIEIDLPDMAMLNFFIINEEETSSQPIA